jgi:hypothetical protein
MKGEFSIIDFCFYRVFELFLMMAPESSSVWVEQEVVEQPLECILTVMKPMNQNTSWMLRLVVAANLGIVQFVLLVYIWS